ncbi:hypothetical protein GLOIN_2v1483623 [Rhizophagus clarus]|uniref:Ion transport domain-containing protein n=1 Tax=Rhizophagus clarus TaxID=94130 RepID=A0A8H3MGN0_9GLOM|nr:hypothetical protein GLOIN_2v1483623 [Rhizophagus clarus]
MEDLENASYGENNPLVQMVMENEINDKAIDLKATRTTIKIDNKKFFDKKPTKILGWSLAVSDIIDNDVGLVAISCITDEDMSQKETIEEGSRQKAYLKLSSINIREIHYSLLNVPYQILTQCILFLILVLPEYFYISKILKDDSKQYQLSQTSSEGLIKLFKFSFMNNNYDNGTSIFHLGGIVTFLKNSENTSKYNAILVCTNCVKIKKFKIKLNENISIIKKRSYLLPENLFKKLESVKDAKINWKNLLKSRNQEFLMINTNDDQKTKSIEIYNINTLQLVISKRFNNICEIKLIEFIENDEKLFIIEQGNGDDVKFHIWFISGCLNDYFPIPKSDIPSSDNISISLKYDEYYYTLTKGNGKVAFLNGRDNENQFNIISKVYIEMATFEENDNVTDKHEHLYYSHDIEPWNDKIEYICELFGVTSSHEKDAGMLHRPQKEYGSYPYYVDLKLYDDFKLTNEDLKSTNDLEFALKFCKDRDGVILAYLLEYYSENSMTHIGWMVNVTKVLPELSLSNHEYYANYMDLLLYKPCFGEMKYNFPIKRFRELSVRYDTLKVYMPLTKLISPKEIFEYKRIRRAYFPFNKNLNEEDLSPFLQIEKNENEFFNIPSMEAAINSRWRQTLRYWVGPLSTYIILLIVFSTLSQIFLSNDGLLPRNEYGFGIYVIYHNGAQLLIMQMASYKSKYFTIFNMLDLISIILVIIDFTLILLARLFGLSIGISNEIMIILTTVTILILWIKLRCSFTSFNEYDCCTNEISNLNVVDTFNKAKEDGNRGLLMYRVELIGDFERFDDSFYKPLYTSYICFHQNPELMKKWMKKSQELRETKLYSWFNESVNKETITFNNEDIESWYEALILSNENQDFYSF